MRLLYRIFVWIYPKAAWLLSFYNPKAKLWVNGRKQQFRKLSMIFHTNQQPVVWMHCSSLGEFEQGKPVLESIRQQYPQYFILISFFSPSGYEIRKHDTVADYVCYLPMDRPYNASRFLNIVQPSLVFFVKYEFWFYYLDEIRQRNIPLLLVSGIFRPDQAFFKWYGKFYRGMLQKFSHLFLQNKESYALLQQLELSQDYSVAGDTRFDRVLQIAGRFEPLPLIASFCGSHPVIVAGSTWTDDDEALDHFANTYTDIRFIIAPHDIDEDRLKECEHLYQHSIRYSALVAQPDAAMNRNVLIMDNMGMLSKLYHYATIAYIGGGFGDDGIHNALEAAVFGKPVVFGPVYDKYQEAIDLVDTGAAFSIEDALELEEQLKELLSNQTLLKQSGRIAGDYVREQAGATAMILHYIQANRLLTN
ncbi:glycosyltransferase N-terminal domain-containing protein [Sediminibacterium sp.]|uniref:3-deoxy-D-manno-octulosonic acid transferase n=1 Tax=Sediminibacterium sp. TaxID=1917865 RepID=UPI0025FF9DA9|nr:glycosyltransferase N-terminal domain-containing protein [Sediminibacterium sp.]MBW0179330.1 3-deoxy-D-manno-octulosonic acid transferase [Sediminibacterium sp.]